MAYEFTSVYLNGDFVAPEKATISAFDRGFIFGDGVYEVIPVYNGLLFRVEEHLTRLENSLRGLDIPNPKSRIDWLELFNQLVTRNKAENQYIYLQVSRGVAARDHCFSTDIKPTVFAYIQPMKIPGDATVTTGVKAITLEDTRWLRCELKTTALLANVLLKQEACLHNACDAILHRDGIITEGSSSTVFIVNHNTVLTPPLSKAILPGVTRIVILELLKEAGISYSEASIKIETLRQADEIWLASSTKEVVPVTTLDNATVGDGHPGPLFKRLWKQFQNHKRDIKNVAVAASSPCSR